MKMLRSCSVRGVNSGNWGAPLPFPDAVQIKQWALELAGWRRHVHSLGYRTDFSFCFWLIGAACLGRFFSPSTRLGAPPLGGVGKYLQPLRSELEGVQKSQPHYRDTLVCSPHSHRRVGPSCSDSHRALSTSHSTIADCLMPLICTRGEGGPGECRCHQLELAGIS
jgi:hypothetical protein